MTPAELLKSSIRGAWAITEPAGRAVLEPAGRAVGALVPRILDAVLNQVDLTRLVIDRVDLDAVVAEVDVDTVVARADVDAVIARIDLIALAGTIIDGVDLPEIIRDSTGSIASEGIRGVRMQTIDADERVNRLVDRVLLRRQARATEAPVPQPRSPLNGDAP